MSYKPTNVLLTKIGRALSTHAQFVALRIETTKQHCCCDRTGSVRSYPTVGTCSGVPVKEILQLLLPANEFLAAGSLYRFLFATVVTGSFQSPSCVRVRTIGRVKANADRPLREFRCLGARNRRHENQRIRRDALLFPHG
jgi:hypothetical protein